ncbi:hypothetical protein E3Q24_02346 [Wallemia mellicola]|nr:hypothetical protein E3Q24_02346 [Wallemia mellicola]
MSSNFGLKRGITDVDIEHVIHSATASTEAAANLLRNSPMNTPGAGIGASGRDGRTHLFVGNLPYRVRWQDLKDLFRKAGTVLRADVALGLDNRSKGYGNVLMGSEIDAAKAIELYNGYVWQTRTLEVRPDRLPPEYDLPGPQSQPHNQTIRPYMGAIQPNMLQHWNQPVFNGMMSGAHVPPRMFPDSATLEKPNSSYANVAQQFQDVENPAMVEPILNKGFSAPSARTLRALGSSPPANLATASTPSLTNRNIFVGNLPYNMQWQELKDTFRAAGNVIRAEVATNHDGTSKGYGIITFADESEAIQGVQMFDGSEIAGRLLKVHIERGITQGSSSLIRPLSLVSDAFSNQLNPNVHSAQSTPNSGLGIIPATAGSSSGFSTGSANSDVTKTSPFPTPLSPPVAAQPSPSYPLPRMTDTNEIALAASKKMDELTIQDGLDSKIDEAAKSPKNAAHPGKISLPPATFSNNPFSIANQQHPPSRGGAPPMTPSMPGFFLGPYGNALPPGTPTGYAPEMLSPGIGPFSPGVLTSPSAHYNPYLNPAPGAPIYYGPSTPAGTPGGGYNPMFPPVYQFQYPHYQHHQQQHQQQQPPLQPYEKEEEEALTEDDGGYPFPLITGNALTKTNNDSAVSSGSDATTVPVKDNADELSKQQVYIKRMGNLQKARAHSHGAKLQSSDHSSPASDNTPGDDIRPQLLHQSKT